MKEVYRFSNWMSLPRMKDPKGLTRVEVGKTSETTYEITIISDLQIPQILYKFKVCTSVPGEGVWALTQEEAVNVLNIIGYPCELISPELLPNPNAIRILKALKELSYSLIYKDSKGFVRIAQTSAGPKYSLNMICPDTHQSDWEFLPRVGGPINIDDILKQSEMKG